MSEAIIARKSIAKVTYKYETIYNNIYVDIEQIIYNLPLSSFVPMSMSYTVPNHAGNSYVRLYWWRWRRWRRNYKPKWR